VRAMDTWDRGRADTGTTKGSEEREVGKCHG
jgi:hypothetical protein